MRIKIGALFLFLSSLSGYGQDVAFPGAPDLTQSQIAMSSQKRVLVLKNRESGKTKKIKEGGFASIKLRNDTSIIEGFLEAFLIDSVVVSSFRPELAGDEIAMNFLEYRVISFDEIESISYSIRHRGRGSWASFLLTLTGMEMAVLPVIVPLLIGNTEEVYSKPQFPYLIAGGVVMYFIGRRIQKSLIPEEYHLSTLWEYKVIKK